jgi:transcriptional regulator with XRE-family HTH domain
MTTKSPESSNAPARQPAVVTQLEAAAANKGDDIGTLCETLGVSEGYYRQLATGIRPVSTVSLDLAKRMADYVGVSLDDMYKLLRSEGGRPQPPHLTGERRKFH